MNTHIKRYGLLLIISIIFGILDYYVCDLVVYVFKAPIFCDMIFCMAISFFAGPIWGILVVIFDHLFDMLVSHSFVIYHLYMITAFLGCVVVWLFKKYFMKDTDSPIKTIGKLLILSLIMCLVMSVSGGIVSRIIDFILKDEGYSYQTDFIKTLFNGKMAYPLLDSILVRIPVNLLDRLITVFASWGVFLLMRKISDKKVV